MGAAAPAYADDVPTAPPPPPQPGKARLQVVAPIHFHGRAYIVEGSRVQVVGRVQPYVAGQTLRVRVSSPHRKSSFVRAAVKKGGAFKVLFRARRAVRYTITASHGANAQQAAFIARASAQAINARGAGPGSHGLGVALLKQGMRALGYPAGNGPFWTDKLGREVMAFRKVNHMARVFTANHAVFAKVFAHKGAFPLRHKGAGKHAEFNWSLQVLALADGDKVVATYHASSGKPSTPTVFGTFHFYTKAPGTNAKGMFMSNYFVRGYAIHGYPDVPTYPASHGCIRVPNADAISIFNQISIGETIFVYR